MLIGSLPLTTEVSNGLPMIAVESAFKCNLEIFIQLFLAMKLCQD